MLAAEAERTGTIPDGWPSKLVVVPAVYNEWDMPEGATVPDVVPAWARPTYGKNKYTIGPLYQRRFESKPNFVPNHSGATDVRQEQVHHRPAVPATVRVQAQLCAQPLVRDWRLSQVYHRQLRPAP